MPHELRIAIASAPDAAATRRRALETIAALNVRLAGQATLAPVPAPSEDAEVALVLAWNEADDAFAEVLARSATAPDTVLFARTDPPAVALADRAEVLRRLAARERLDELVDRYRERIRLVPYERDVGAAVERELVRLIEARTGLRAAPLDVRPRLDGTYLERPRLLRRLPDTPGHVVVLTAPYGSGKSVLAAQWAAQLEEGGQRVIWLGMDDGDGAVAPRLATALGVAADTPSAWLRERLWEVPTVVVVEGLAPDADPEPLLDDPGGFVLLAGREPLRASGLARLEEDGRLTRLGPADLAFTEQEAVRLVGDDDEARRLQATTVGWALPLHVAALTGSAPEPGALVAGIRASLTEPCWHELLFLAAVPHLPLAACRSETDRLVASGFVQALGNAVRLHPWFADLLRERERDAVAEAAAEHANRLPLRLRGEAYARSGDAERLAGVLAQAADAELWREAPTRLVAWDATVDGFSSPERDWAVGAAHGRLGAFDEAIVRLTAAVDAASFGPEKRLAVARELCVPLGVNDPETGRLLLERAEAWIPDAGPEVAARFLGNAAIFHAHTGSMADAVETAQRALALFPPDSPHRVAAEVNLALFGWNLTGDFDARLAAQAATLERVSATYPVQALGQCRDLGVFHAWLGDWQAARDFLERAAAGAAINPSIAVEARAALAYLDGDRDGVSEQLRAAASFPNAYVADIVAMYRILLDLEADDLANAHRAYEASPRGTFATSAHARTLAARGETDAALALLDAEVSDDRVRRLYLAAARYEVTRDRSDLDAFLSVTTAGARLLPGFLPLATLPADTDLAAHYPIEEVLRSGRADAIAAREEEVPPLRIDLLGGVEVRLLGEPLELTGRHRQIVTLLVMRLSREEVGEAVWPETDAKKQRNNLGVQLAGLRKAIEPWGVPTYLGDGGLTRVSSDYRDLLAALRAGDASTVLSLYRGPLAPGIELRPVQEERVRLDEAVIATLYEAADDSPQAERLLLRVLELEPLHEEALQRLLATLIRRGRRREAAERYRRFADQLRADLDLEPMPETRALVGA